MAEGSLERIVRESGVPGLVELLAERLSPSDFQSLMLEVYRSRAAGLSPAELLARYDGNRFTAPSELDPAALAAFEQTAWSLLPAGYEALELGPLCPLGTCSVVATVDQNKVVSTVRNLEVVADSTNLLALECAVRRRSLLRSRATRFDPVLLASSQRQVRAQALASPSHLAHFRLLALCAAGRDQGSFSFEAESLREQIGYLVSVIGETGSSREIAVALTDLNERRPALEAEVLLPLSRRFPEAGFRIDQDRESGRGYYVDACYKVYTGDGQGGQIEVGDGGCTPWTRDLLSDRKERLVIAGLGVERLLR